jgi:hypothetical protein
MVKYEYVTIENEKKASGKYTKHREVIDEYAKKGFKYVGYVPTKLSAYGLVNELDLIFEE